MGFLAVLFWFAIGVLSYRFEVRYWDDGVLTSVFAWIGLFSTCFYIAHLQFKKSQEIHGRDWKNWLHKVEAEKISFRAFPNFPDWKKNDRSKWQKFWYWAFFIK